MSNNLAPFQSDPTSAGAADTASIYVQTNLVSDIAGLGAMGVSKSTLSIPRPTSW